MNKLVEDVKEKIISKKSLNFLEHLDKNISNLPFLNFLKGAILRVEDWGKLSNREFFEPVKKHITKFNNNVYDLTPVIDIIELINGHAKISNKKKYGEVITPFSIVNDMLDKLPKNVWNNPYLKWFDPTNGLGNFPIVIIQRLMQSLENYKDDKLNLTIEADRYKHIVENMIYMCDIQTNNNFFITQFIHNINLYTQSFLRNDFEHYMKNVWKVDKFDIIVSHPPYNSIYPNFTEKSVSLLSDNGYLLQVNPASWRKPQSDKSRTQNMWKLLTQENNLKYLEIHSLKDGNNVFGEYRRYDIFLMQKTRQNGKTLVVDEHGLKSEVDLAEWDFLPNYNIDKIRKLLGENCSRILFSRSAYGQDRPYVSEVEIDRYKYPLVHYIKEDGPIFMYSSINDKGFFGVSKIIFGEKGLHDVIIDMGGEYGMTSHSFALRIDTYGEALEIKKFLLSDYFKEIIASCSWGSYSISLSKPPCFIDWRLFTYFKEEFWK